MVATTSETKLSPRVKIVIETLAEILKQHAGSLDPARKDRKAKRPAGE